MSTNTKSQEEGKPEAELPFHPAADIFKLMEGAEFEELVEDIQRRGLITPITIINKPIPRADGSVSIHERQKVIIDGRNRALACAKAGVEPRYEEFDGDEEDVIRYIISANIHRRHLKPEERRERLKQLIAWHPEKSDRAIAAEAGVNQSTVSRVRKSTDAGASVGKRIGRDGKTRRMPTKTKPAKPELSKTLAPAAASQTMPGTVGPMLPDPPADDIWASLDIPPALDRRPKANGASPPAESTERDTLREREVEAVVKEIEERVNADLSARVREAERKVIALESEIEELKLENEHLKRENAELRQGLNPRPRPDADDAQVEKLLAAMPAIDKKLN